MKAMDGRPLLSDEEVEALRTLVSFIRRDMSRAELAAKADVSPVDLDNFITLRSGTSEKRTYKTKRPSEIFQIKMLQYLSSHQAFRIKVGANSSLAYQAYTRLERKLDFATYFSSGADTMYRFFDGLGVLSVNICRQISKELAGNYYMYRYGSGDGNIVKTFIRVHGFDVYQKVPRFEHFKKEKNGNIRYSSGIIMDLGGRYVFSGLISGKGGQSANEYVGVKIIILNHGSFGSKTDYHGMYVSCDDARNYDFGAAVVVKTPDNYAEGNIGLYPISRINLPSLNHLRLPISATCEPRVVESSVQFKFESQ
jgi:hypothetical protein